MDTNDRTKRNKRICQLSARGKGITEIAEALNLNRFIVWKVRAASGYQDDYARRCSVCKKFRRVSEFDAQKDQCKLCLMKDDHEQKVRRQVAAEVKKIERNGTPGKFTPKKKQQRLPTIESIDHPYPRRKKDSLKTKYPEIAAQWDHEKNEGYKPEDFGPRSKVSVWWKCPAGPDHEFQGPINTRTWAADTGSKFKGCPFCRGFKPSITNCLANYKDFAEEWISERNGCTPDKAVAGSKKHAWWRCSKCQREWKAPPCDRTSKGQGCPACGRGVSTDLSHYPKALKLFDREKNKDCSPYALKDKTKYWWKCPVAKDHRWNSGFSRTSKITCPYCRGIRPSSTNNLSLRPDIAKEFHTKKNAPAKAKDVTLYSHKAIWWKCDQGPDHEWKAEPRNRVRHNHGCPFCKNLAVSITNCLANVAPKIAKEWNRDKNSPLKAKDVVAMSTFVVWWTCTKGHDYQMKVRNRVLRGSGCPKCS